MLTKQKTDSEAKVQQFPPSVESVLGPALSFPLGLSHSLWYVRNRIAFIGDTIHRYTKTTALECSVQVLYNLNCILCYSSRPNSYLCQIFVDELNFFYWVITY